MTAEPAALVAVAALLLVPGLLAARAPFHSVPALSASFWIVSSWWLPASLGRERLLRALLVSGGLLALVRLRDMPWGRPRPRVVALAAAAVLPLALAFLVEPPPGTSLDTISASVVAWNDGIPRTFQPFLDLAPFGADAPGLATLAADAALVSSSSPRHAVLLVGLAGPSLLMLGVLGLGLHRGARSAAALYSAAALALFALAAAHLSRSVFQADPMILALALALSSCAILRGGDSLLRSLAAGLVLAASLLTQTLVGLAALLALAFLLRPWSSRQDRNRAILTLGLALLLVAPQIQRLGPALSGAELAGLLGAKGSRACPNLPWIYQEEALRSPNPCALTSFDKLL